MSFNLDETTTPATTGSQGGVGTTRDVGFDVVEPWLPAATAAREQKFKDRKYRLNGDVWLIISVFRDVVCIHIRELKDGWKFEGGVSMNIREYQWFMCESPPSSGQYDRISVAKQKTGSLIKRVDARIANTSAAKPRRILVTNQGFANMVRQKKAINRDIEEAKQFVEERGVRVLPNYELIRNILVLLATKIYEKRRRSGCAGCSGSGDCSNLMSHQCIAEGDADRMKLASASLKDVPSGVLWSVMACNNLPHPGSDVATIIGDRSLELVEKVAKYKLTDEAQQCFDVYYNANFDIMSMANDTWQESQCLQEDGY